MAMADRIDDRSDPHLGDLEPAEAESDPLDDEEATEADAQHADPGTPGTPAATEKGDRDEAEKKQNEEPEPLPPVDPVSEKELAAFLRAKSTRDAMIKVVTGRVRDAVVEDVVQVAHFEVSRAKGLPKGANERLQYARAVARNTAITWYRRKEKDKPEPAPLDELRGQGAEDPGIQRTAHADHIEKIAATVPEKERGTWVCFVRHVVRGESIAELAREMHIEESTLLKRVTTMRQRLSVTAAALAGIALLILGLSGMWKHFQSEGQTAQPEPSTVPSQERPEPQPQLPTGTVPWDQPSRRGQAAELREKARKECAAKQWTSCLASYDVAQGLDPDGETPEVKAAHEKALAEVWKRAP